MSGIQGLGSPAANYAATLLSSSAASQNDAGELPIQPGSVLSPTQLEQLKRKLQQDVEQSFQQANQGKSLSDVAQTLRQKVSDTLAKYGFSDSDRNAVLGQIDQIFAGGASRSDVRQQVQQLLQDTVSHLEDGGAAAASPASVSSNLGQSLDLTG